LTKTLEAETIGQNREADLSYFIGMGVAVLWDGWPKDMEAVTLPDPKAEFSLRGKCPHCAKDAAFSKITSSYIEPLPDEAGQRICAAMQCPGCLKYILAVVTRQAKPRIAGIAGRPQLHTGFEPHRYEAHYPIGSPDDSVDSSIPPAIAADFQEALRCRWVNAFKATVTMCRRALEASCLDLGAKGDTLIAQIAKLASEGQITTSLKNMASHIRLAGNRGSHPKDDGLADIGRDDADAVIAFTRQYFEHVYVMPALAKNYEAKRKAPDTV
jgi:hypothetical protein